MIGELAAGVCVLMQVSAQEQTSFEQTYIEGELKVVLSVNPVRVTPVQSIEFRLKIEHPVGMHIETSLSTVKVGDEIGRDVGEDSAGRLTVGALEKLPVQVEGMDWLVEGVELTLEPYLPGVFEIESVLVTGIGEDGKEVQIETDVVRVEVGSLVSGDGGGGFADFREPVEGTESGQSWWWVVPGMVVIASGVGAGIWRRRLREASSETVQRLRELKHQLGLVSDELIPIRRDRVRRVHQIVREAMEVGDGLGMSLTVGQLSKQLSENERVLEDRAGQILRFERLYESLIYAGGDDERREELDDLAEQIIKGMIQSQLQAEDQG